MSSALTLRSVVSAAARQVSSEVKGEQVILDLEDGTYYGLDTVGARIWVLLQEPRAAACICETIMAEYEVEQERCQRDVLALLLQLAERKLIEVCDVARPETAAAHAG